jgi:hypothetical protein
MTKYVDVAAPPTRGEGNLVNKYHIFHGEENSLDDCGSHGCTGHTSYYLVCDCGFSAPCSYETEQVVIQRHELDVIKYQLGLKFFVQ